MASQRILIISTPVGPLGSGVGGGVELTLHSLVLGLTGRGTVLIKNVRISENSRRADWQQVKAGSAPGTGTK